jgi:hypothetical protein
MYKILVGKPEGKKSHGRPTCTKEDNIKMDLRRLWWEILDWICLTQDRDRWLAHVIMIMNHRVP